MSPLDTDTVYTSVPGILGGHAVMAKGPPRKRGMKVYRSVVDSSDVTTFDEQRAVICHA